MGRSVLFILFLLHLLFLFLETASYPKCVLIRDSFPQPHSFVVKINVEPNDQQFPILIHLPSSVMVEGLCTSYCAQSFGHVWLFVNPWTVALQASLSVGYSRQEYESGLPFPSSGDFPNPGIQPVASAQFPALQVSFFTVEPLRKQHESVNHSVMFNSLGSPGFSVHGILQARILEWVSIPSPDLAQPGT